LSQKEIDLPKSFINLTDVHDRFFKEIGDWKLLELNEPKIEWERRTKLTKKGRDNLPKLIKDYDLYKDENAWVEKVDANEPMDWKSMLDYDKYMAIIKEVKPLLYLEEKYLTEEQKELVKDFGVHFIKKTKKIRPRFMNDLFESNKSFLYDVYNTPMDWIRPIVANIEHKKPTRGKTIYLYDVMTKKKIKDGEHNKIKAIIERAEESYTTYQKYCVDKDWNQAFLTKDDFIDYLNKDSFDSDTVYHLIREVYKMIDSTNKKGETVKVAKYSHRNFILKCLCRARLNDVVDCFKSIDSNENNL